jgi:hypothetical protein
VQDRRKTLVAACQVAGIGAAGLLLPCSLIDLAFDTDLLSIVAQAMLAAFACALACEIAIRSPDTSRRVRQRLDGLPIGGRLEAAFRTS